uniref:Transposase Tc1-like domain-containing protein n=1 Tax=Amphiprion ocellaris TaxID=80972 RepID=A0A3Q1CLE5_AMPOC
MSVNHSQFIIQAAMNTRPRHRTTGSVCDRPRSGAPRVMECNDDRYLRTYALRHRYATATQLQACLREVRGTRVSRQTIRNRLHRFGLNSRRPLQVTPLTPRHRCDLLQWAQEHVTWAMQHDWILVPHLHVTWQNCCSTCGGVERIASEQHHEAS